MISLRPMGIEDIPSGLSLCRSAGWNQRAEEWKLFLSLSPDNCRVAVDDNAKVVGTVATVSYQHHFSWIGMVLVDPAIQRQGIGMKLLNEAIEVLKEQETIKLDATPAGRTVYLKLNFQDEYEISRMQLISSLEKDTLVTSAQLLSENDWPEILKLDAKVFGADRATLLKWMWQNAPDFSFVVKEGNIVRGFCMGREGYNFTHIGPVVTERSSVAVDLVSAVLKNQANQPVIMDVLHHSPEWLAWIGSIGFTVQRPLIRMYRGTNLYPGKPEHQFAILGPEFG